MRRAAGFQRIGRVVAQLGRAEAEDRAAGRHAGGGAGDGVFDHGAAFGVHAQGCGSGDPSLGESAQGCHFNRQRLRLTAYEPLTSEQCGAALGGDLVASPAAQQNYQSAQLQMEVDPERSPLLVRPTSTVAHPRVIFDADSPEADVIRAWATGYASR